MTKLTVLIGLPASGKSTIARQISSNTGAVVHSSDEIRMELYGSYGVMDKNNEIFDKMKERTISDLEKGKSVVYDATNLSMKKRKYLLALIPKNIITEALVIATMVDVCIERDNIRSKSVGKNVIKKMWQNFQFPLYGEGFDEVNVKYTHEYDWMENYEKWSNIAVNVEQDNPNHTMTIGDHCTTASELYCTDAEEDIVPYYSFLDVALLLHDYGKIWTKTYKNKKGEKTDIAHYYNHHNVSAYQAMFMDKVVGEMEKYEIQLINYHMQPYFINTPKSERKWRNIFGDNLYEDLLIMNKYDRLAH